MSRWDVKPSANIITPANNMTTTDFSSGGDVIITGFDENPHTWTPAALSTTQTGSQFIVSTYAQRVFFACQIEGTSTQIMGGAGSSCTFVTKDLSAVDIQVSSIESGQQIGTDCNVQMYKMK